MQTSVELPRVTVNDSRNPKLETPGVQSERCKYQVSFGRPEKRDSTVMISWIRIWTFQEGIEHFVKLLCIYYTTWKYWNLQTYPGCIQSYFRKYFEFFFFLLFWKESTFDGSLRNTQSQRLLKRLENIVLVA